MGHRGAQGCSGWFLSVLKVRPLTQLSACSGSPRWWWWWAQCDSTGAALGCPCPSGCLELRSTELLPLGALFSDRVAANPPGLPLCHSAGLHWAGGMKQVGSWPGGHLCSAVHGVGHVPCPQPQTAVGRSCFGLLVGHNVSTGLLMIQRNVSSRGTEEKFPDSTFSILFCQG